MPTKLKMANTRSSKRKVVKPTIYGSKPTPPQRGKRSVPAKARDVITTSVAKAPSVKKLAQSLKKADVQDVLVDTSESEKSINQSENESEGGTKYPWNNYSKKYLHGKWKAANKVATELRESKKTLSSEVLNLKKDVTYWKKEASSNQAVSTKNSTSDERVRNAKLDLLEEKAKNAKTVGELKERIAAQKNEHTTAITLKKMEISKLKLDNQMEVNAEKLKVEKLNLANKSLSEKNAEMKNVMDQMKEKMKEYEKIKMQSIKNNLQLKKQMEQADIRYVFYFVRELSK